MKELEVLRKYVSDEKLVKHCLAVSAVMRGIARELGEDENMWARIGLLHDIDYEIVGEDMDRHGEVGAEILEREGYGDIAEIVKRHNHMRYGDYREPVELALQAADSVSGLIIACALVKGGKISEVTPKTVKKKFKEKSFAAGCDRNRIRLIEGLMPLEKLYEVGIESLKEIKDELGLS
ncbi:HD domain-containing protein [Geoglobus acetivorans]|uniref:HDIG domain-containing protein n=1 Tax=Geoglobus acetivorans TaxID=565033 RepID=A0ABZ3H0B5_GEOAI|nr:HDIG domain-containing protein [Geoglobus acetivorans]